MPELSEDRLLKNHKSDLCPKGKEKAKANIKGILAATIQSHSKILASVAQKVKSILKITPKKELDFKSLKALGDTITSDHFENPDSPLIDISSGLGNYLQNLNFVNHMQAFMTKDFSKIAITNLIKEIVGHIAGKVKSESQTGSKKPKKPFPYKLVYYSLHDTNISPLLRYLDMIDFECNLRQMAHQDKSLGCIKKPLYAANVVFELAHKLATDGSIQWAVFFRINGEYYDVCGISSPERHKGNNKWGKPTPGKVACPLDTFYKRFEEIIKAKPEEHTDYCELPRMHASKQPSSRMSKETIDSFESFSWKHPISLLCIALLIMSVILIKNIFKIKNLVQKVEDLEAQNASKKQK